MTSARGNTTEDSGGGPPTDRQQASQPRRARAIVAALAVVAVVAVVLLASSVLRHRAATPPLAAAFTTPATTASPDRTPSETPSPTIAPTVDPGLPPYHQLTASILAGAGAGWVVGVYEPVADVDKVSPRVLVISPDGTVYRAADPKVDHASPIAWSVAPVRWEAGSQRMVVELGQGDSSERTALDLLTGDLVGDTRGRPSSSSFAGLAADGSEVWWDGYHSGVWVVPPTGQARQVADGLTVGTAVTDQAVDPSGRYVAVVQPQDSHQPEARVLDLTTGHVTPVLMTPPAGHSCDFAGWADPARAMLACTPTSGTRVVDSVVTIDVSGTTPVRVSSHDYVPGELRPALGANVPALLRWVGHDRLVTAAATTADGADECTLRAAWFDSSGRAVSTQDPVPAGPVGIRQVEAAGGVAYIGEWSGCPQGLGLAGLTSVTSAGRTTTLIPHTPDDQAGTFEWTVAR